ncbi:hypothetical protein NQ318_005105 [Aromia moschata]|uniref:Uncharacterized protein n=1 Tax=Aromia moschata TaxID=1265417 RepID=A0AAV8YF50_9CUCU|nr:hypothetical protein NQ318_005105 [Aromia moschata]
MPRISTVRYYFNNATQVQEICNCSIESSVVGRTAFVKLLKKFPLIKLVPERPIDATVYPQNAEPKVFWEKIMRKGLWHISSLYQQLGLHRTGKQSVHLLTSLQKNCIYSIHSQLKKKWQVLLGCSRFCKDIQNSPLGKQKVCPCPEHVE